MARFAELPRVVEKDKLLARCVIRDNVTLEFGQRLQGRSLTDFPLVEF